MPSRLTRFGVSLPACALAGSLLVAAQTPPSTRSTQSIPSRTAKEGVYSDQQARRGQAIYKDRCASCHGATLGGGNAPPLAGDAFIGIWGGPLSDLVDKIQNTMPQDDPGKLSRQQSADVVAYMLEAGKFPAGRADLGTDQAMLKQIALAPGQTAPPIAAAGTQALAFPPAGNLNQVMRGILFPSSNIIFNVQTNDPGAPAPKLTENQAKDAAFSMTAWGAGIYKGWEIIDYAAVALAESAPLMLTPGRRCENGRPVPVTDADWIKFTLELAETGRAAYKASQTRNQEVVSEITEQIANACLHCHQVYRDNRRGGNPVDRSNQSSRCMK
jgi:mono/diheme cytochrome c family protein